MDRLKILIFIKPFADKYPKHKHKYDMIMEIGKFAEVQYWQEDGDIEEILKRIPFKPDFIFQYDVISKNLFSPKITGLDKTSIPKGCLINDPQSAIEKRKAYFEGNKIDLIFSLSKVGFLEYYPQYEKKMRWMPFSINPEVIKDWKLNKDIDFLLMGLIFYNTARAAPNGGYCFREKVLKRMKDVQGFVYIPHPGHCAPPSEKLVVNEKYAQILNKSKIFFTCGSARRFPVAKFFEAPGCKTLLLAKPNKDILELGFKDGVNFVACDENDFYDKAMYYIRNAKERNRITDKGYKFIHSFHTNEVRAKQFIKHINDFIGKKA